MSERTSRYKNVATIAVLCLFFILLIGFTSNREKNSIIEDGIAIPINGIQRVVYKISKSVGTGVDNLINYGEIKTKNEELESEINQLKSKIARLTTIEKDYEDLKKILDYRDTRDDYEFVVSEITARSGNGYFKGFRINRGTKDGIEKRMVAVTPDGLVGQVTSVGLNWAEVQTFANENIAVAGYIYETDEMNGIVRGYKDYENSILARIELPTLGSPMKVGDQVYTSGVGNIYPKGIKIGEIIEVYDNKGKVVKYGIIEPSVDVDKIDKLSIIIPKKEEIDE